MRYKITDFYIIDIVLLCIAEYILELGELLVDVVFGYRTDLRAHENSEHKQHKHTDNGKFLL